jgi:hypothetical protein
VYRRAPLFLSERFCRCFVQRIEEVRQELKFLLLGWREIADLTNQRSAPAGVFFRLFNRALGLSNTPAFGADA